MQSLLNGLMIKRKAEYDTYDDELKVSVDKCFDCI